jgi:hypothetical protein
MVRLPVTSSDLLQFEDREGDALCERQVFPKGETIKMDQSNSAGKIVSGSLRGQ